jgi:peptidyl-tRNA hydrolase ICT1
MIKNMIIKYPARINKKGDVLIQSDRYRTQAQNMQDCIQKLAEMVKDTAASVIPREASEETLERIKKL